MGTPFVQPPPVERRRHHGGIVGPLLLIFVGGVFLLQNTGHLPPNAWMSLWRLWPLVLVLVGLELLLVHRVAWIALAGLALLVLVAGGMATMAWPSAPTASPVSRSSSTDLGSAQRLAVGVRFGAGQLNVGPLAEPASGQAATMTFSGPADLMPQSKYATAPSGVGQLDYQMTGRGGPAWMPMFGDRSDDVRMDLNLNPSIPISSLSVQSGAAEAHIDLSNLQVSALDLSVGAESTWLRFPQDGGSTTAHVSGGMSSITIEIPQGVAAQIRYRGGLSTLTVDQTRFPLVSQGLYRSADYSSAQNSVDLELASGFTKIQVN